jgi:hypothetical protein
MLGFQLYSFTYDIIYPVKITLVDKKTKHRDKYTFSFAFNVIIEHNRGVRELFEPVAYMTGGVLSREEYCEQELDKEITIYTYDNITHDELGGVNISFICGPYRCEIGKTEYVQTGVQYVTVHAELTKPFPYCTLGILKAVKPGYEELTTPLSTMYSRELELYLTPIKLFENYSVVKHSLESPLIGHELEENETAMINIKINNTDYTTTGIYELNQPLAGLPIKLYDKKEETYMVEIYLMGETIKGGYKGEWHITPTQLADAKSIRFHVVEFPAVTDESALISLFNNLTSYSTQIPKPELIR